MMPHCARDTQFELFEAEAHAAMAGPKLALPIQRSSEIDITRLRVILGVAKNTALRMVKAKLFRASMRQGGWRIDYSSVVEYCDRLRLEYRISTRTVGAAKGMRRRDRDLLPFPMDETKSAAEVREVLDCGTSAVIKLIEEGKLVGYQVLVDTPGCPWRIHVRSLELYVARLRAAAEAAPRLRRSSTVI